VVEASPDGGIHYLPVMSYSITLRCGCSVYVACHPQTGIAHTRVLDHRSERCSVRGHEVGLHLKLWELLPDPAHRPTALFMPSENRRPSVPQGWPALGVRRKAC
jgi:hypothetical protein